MAVQESAVQTELKAGALKLPHVIMQSVTSIAPAISVLYSFQFVVSLSGTVAPLAYVLSFIIVLIIGINLSELSRTFPSAGGYYTYVSKALNPRMGFLTGWMYLIYTPLSAAPILVYMGYVLQNTLKTYGIIFPWGWFFLIGFVITFLVMYRGIELSGKTMLILGLIEMVIVVALSVWGFFEPGNGGISFKPFNFSLAPSGLALAVIFTLFGYSGWEAAAPMAEESDNPRKTVPLALIGSIVIMAVILMLCTWGLQVGWGINNMSSLVKSSDLPPIVLAHKFWGAGWLIVIFALVNSTIAVCIATGTVSTRMWYAMARDGAFPAAFRRIHPKYKTPSTAIWFQMGLTLVAGLGGAALVGADQIWYVDGLMLTFALAFIYGIGSVGLFVYRWKGRKDPTARFSIIRHGIFPLISLVCLVWLVYASLVPYPAYPSSIAPILAGVWPVVGIVVLVVMRVRGREDWILNVGRSSQTTTLEVND